MKNTGLKPFDRFWSTYSYFFDIRWGDAFLALKGANEGISVIEAETHTHTHTHTYTHHSNSKASIRLPLMSLIQSLVSWLSSELLL